MSDKAEAQQVASFQSEIYTVQKLAVSLVLEISTEIIEARELQ